MQTQEVNSTLLCSSPHVPIPRNMPSLLAKLEVITREASSFPSPLPVFAFL